MSTGLKHPYPTSYVYRTSEFSRVSNFVILWSKVVSLFSRVQFFANLKIRKMLILVIRFMADLLRKYRGSVVIMVGRGGAEPHYVHN